MEVISRIITSSTIVLMLSGCGSGGNHEVTITEPIVETPPDTADLELAIEFYLIDLYFQILYQMLLQEYQE